MGHHMGDSFPQSSLTSRSFTVITPSSLGAPAEAPPEAAAPAEAAADPADNHDIKPLSTLPQYEKGVLTAGERYEIK